MASWSLRRSAIRSMVSADDLGCWTLSSSSVPRQAASGRPGIAMANRCPTRYALAFGAVVADRLPDHRAVLLLHLARVVLVGHPPAGEREPSGRAAGQQLVLDELAAAAHGRRRAGCDAARAGTP